jgi:hypothetical protein
MAAEWSVATDCNHHPSGLCLVVCLQNWRVTWPRILGGRGSPANPIDTHEQQGSSVSGDARMYEQRLSATHP